MAWALGFQELASLNPFVRDLDEQGYHVDFIHGYFVIHGLPYLDKAGSLKYGDWISPVDLTEGVLDPPGNHQAWFRGESQYGQDGRELSIGTTENRLEVTADFIANLSFSFKLLENRSNAYVSFLSREV